MSVEQTAAPLNENTGGTHHEANQRRALVAELGNEHTGGNTHNEVGHEVAVITNLGEHRRDFSLVLDDFGHRVAKVSHECNHGEERNHHQDGAPLFFLLTHDNLRLLFVKIWIKNSDGIRG